MTPRVLGWPRNLDDFGEVRYVVKCPWCHKWHIHALRSGESEGMREPDCPLGKSSYIVVRPMLAQLRGMLESYLINGKVPSKTSRRGRLYQYVADEIERVEAGR
jgi:hypothetical protein